MALPVLRKKASISWSNLQASGFRRPRQREGGQGGQTFLRGLLGHLRDTEQRKPLGSWSPCEGEGPEVHSVLKGMCYGSTPMRTNGTAGTPRPCRTIL